MGGRFHPPDDRHESTRSSGRACSSCGALIRPPCSCPDKTSALQKTPSLCPASGQSFPTALLRLPCTPSLLRNTLPCRKTFSLPASFSRSSRHARPASSATACLRTARASLSPSVRTACPFAFRHTKAFRTGSASAERAGLPAIRRPTLHHHTISSQDYKEAVIKFTSG